MIQSNTKMNMSDFYKMFNISYDTWKKRKEEVLLWATNFFIYEVISRQTVLIIEQFAEVEPFPKESGGRKSTKEDVEQFYKALVLSNVHGTTEETAIYKPASVLVRENIDLIYNKFGHKETTAAKYMNEAFHKYVDYTEAGKWVWINKQSTLCEQLTPQEQQELYSYQVESAVDSCEHCAEQLDKVELALAGKAVYSSVKQILVDQKDFLQKFYVRGIKKMIQAHPEKNATFIVRTLGKFEGKYIFDERMLQLLEDAGL